MDPATQIHGAGFTVQRSAHSVTLAFPPLRAPAPSLGLLAFAALCALMPALGLAALLPLKAGDAAGMVSLALIGGFAAPFIMASVVFAMLAIYQLANALHISINSDGLHTQRRVFGYVIRSAHIARADVLDVEPRSSARYQNLFSATPRYALIARHRTERRCDVVAAEDLLGESQMQALRTLIHEVLNIK